MDVRCRVCAEPTDVYEFHDVEDMDYAEAYAAFRAEGCTGVGWAHNGSAASPLIGELQDMLGDDADGFASTLEDFEFLGMDPFDL